MSAQTPLPTPKFFIHVGTFMLSGWVCWFAGPMRFDLMIAAGQAHFLLAYVYQYKAGKMDRAYGFRYAAFFILLFGSYLFVLPDPVLLTVVTAFYFVLHFLYDEHFLFGDRPAMNRWLVSLPLLILYSGIILNVYVERIEAVTQPAALAALFGVGAYLMVQRRAGWPDLYFVLISAAVLAAQYLELRFFRDGYMQVIILAHYANWYMHFVEKQRRNHPFLVTFVRDIVIANGLCFGLYFWLYKTGKVQALRIVFRPDFFYLWTLLHYVATFRKADLSYWKPSLRPAALPT